MLNQLDLPSFKVFPHLAANCFPANEIVTWCHFVIGAGRWGFSNISVVSGCFNFPVSMLLFLKSTCLSWKHFVEKGVIKAWFFFLSCSSWIMSSCPNNLHWGAFSCFNSQLQPLTLAACLLPLFFDVIPLIIHCFLAFESKWWPGSSCICLRQEIRHSFKHRCYFWMENVIWRWYPRAWSICWLP